MKHCITKENLKRFEKYLRREERSPRTVEKYLRDLEVLLCFLAGAPATKDLVLAWKESLLTRGYAAATVNSMLAAANSFFTFLGWHDCRVKPLKLQRRIFANQERELSRAEYLRLLAAAEQMGNRRLYYLMETLCATGIRVSELQFITVEAVKSGQAVVACKGKRRPVLLTKKLCCALLGYCRERHITTGPIFITAGGRPMDRSNIWREMKALCHSAGVKPGKVFPHNFRHLFARCFYNLKKDIAKLADLLGHASIETTRIYIMESGLQHAREVERLGLVL